MVNEIKRAVAVETAGTRKELYKLAAQNKRMSADEEIAAAQREKKMVEAARKNSILNKDGDFQRRKASQEGTFMPTNNFLRSSEEESGMSEMEKQVHEEIFALYSPENLFKEKWAGDESPTSPSGRPESPPTFLQEF